MYCEGLLIVRISGLVALAFSLLALLSSAAMSSEERYFDCPVPNGIEAAQKEYERILFAGMDKELFGGQDGWHHGKVVTGSVNYHAPEPVALPVERYPFFIGPVWGGAKFGGRLSSRMICGFSVSNSDWMVTIEWEGHGFASFDIRDALTEVPAPTSADVIAFEDASKPLPLHEFKFSIDGQDFNYLLTGITVAMNRVYRPDLLKSGYKSSLNDQFFPALDSLSGVLLASAEFGQRPEWRDVDVENERLSGEPPKTRSSDFTAQPVDVTDTPFYLGRLIAASSEFTSEPGQAANLDLDDGILSVTLTDGRTTKLTPSQWIGARLLTSLPGIPAPDLRFDIDGQAFRYIVNLMGPGTDRLMGDLLSGEPQLSKQARQRETQPHRQ